MVMAITRKTWRKIFVNKSKISKYCDAVYIAKILIDVVVGRSRGRIFSGSLMCSTCNTL
jgi:hypothetical protein